MKQLKEKKMSKTKNKFIQSGWLYCYKRGNKTVFLNRQDQVIKEFDIYDEAEQFANNNIKLIDLGPTNRKIRAVQ